MTWVEAVGRGEMWAPKRNASPSLMNTYASFNCARPARRLFTSQPCSDMPASYVSSMKYSWRALRFSAIVGLSADVFFLLISDRIVAAGGTRSRLLTLRACNDDRSHMRELARSALVPYTPSQMFALVADLERYPEFVPWVSEAQVLERGAD